MNRNKNAGNKGLTIVELFVSLGLISIILTMGVSRFEAFFSRMRVTNGVRTVTASFSRARFEAIRGNRRVKVNLEVSAHEIQLMEKRGGRWQVFHRYPLEKKVLFSMNASPVFSPFGSASPLCSTYVENEVYKYKITISMAGRIKTVRLSK